MAELKTKKTAASVEKFFASIPDEQRREDCRALAKMMQEITKAPPKMWGASMVGFGDRHYKYESGREGDWFQVGFAPRKDSLSLYFTCDIAQHADLLARLGKHKTGKGCLYVKRLADVDTKVLKQMIRAAVKGK